MSGNAALAIMVCTLICGVTAYNCMKLWLDHKELMAGMIHNEPEDEDA